MRRRLASLVPFVAAAACASHDDYGVGACLDCAIEDAAPAMVDAPLDEVPATLASTGLCADAACTAINAGIREFAPRWQLWSDGAEKRRWIWLPPGATIDTTDTDYWRFPIGTKLWKEFGCSGTRVETRYLVKTGPEDDDWMFVPYAWNGEQTEAVPVVEGVTDALGTSHDIPAAKDCTTCHGNVKSRVLGFGAFQLDYTAAESLVDLDKAAAAGWFSTALPSPSSGGAHFPLPGSASEQAMLGYFHANCGHCHNSRSQLVNRPMFRIEVARTATLAQTRTYSSTVNVSGIPYGGATIIAKPGDPSHSIIVTRMSSTDPKKKMPWLGAKTTDPTGLAMVRAWITNL